MRELAIDFEYEPGVDPLTDVFADHPDLVLDAIDISLNGGLVRVDRVSGSETALSALEERYLDPEHCNECVAPDRRCEANRSYEVLDAGPSSRTVYTFHGPVEFCHSVPYHAARLLPAGIVLDSSRRGNRHAWRVLLPEAGDVGGLYDALADGAPDGVSVAFKRLTRPRRWGRRAGVLADLPPEQRSALERAIAMDYYGAPRSASLADLAEALEVPQSTARYRLRRAEEWLVSTVVGA